jgi:hypothetical protein
MTDLSVAKKLTEYKPANKFRFVTAASNSRVNFAFYRRPQAP